MVNEQFVGNFSCEWEDVHSTPDFDQVVAFPFPYLHPFVPLNDIVSDIFDLFLGVRVLISHHWCFNVEVANVKTGILCTGSGNSAIDVELGSRQVGCRWTKVAFSLDFVAANGNSDSVLFTFGGRILQTGRRYTRVICLVFVFHSTKKQVPVSLTRLLPWVRRPHSS